MSDPLHSPAHNGTWFGRCVEAGDDDEGQPRILIHTTRAGLMNGRNLVFEECAVLLADELETAEVVAFDGEARTVTLRFDLMPCAAIGERWMVRTNDQAQRPLADSDAGRKGNHE